jgi:hypothetical protein
MIDFFLCQNSFTERHVDRPITIDYIMHKGSILWNRFVPELNLKSVSYKFVSDFMAVKTYWIPKFSLKIVRQIFVCIFRNNFVYSHRIL